MDLMQLGLEPEPDQEDLEPKRAKTLIVSIGIHVLLLGLLVLEPTLFQTTPKRIIRIAGQDFDLNNTQLTELTMPPPPRPRAAPPLVQPPPQPKTETPPPPPPQQATPPPPPPPQMPKEMPVITPEDVLKEGAKPDGKVQASRGNTAQLQAGGGTSGSDQPKTVMKPEPPKNDTPQQLAQNLNPNAMRLPNLTQQAGRILDQTLKQSEKQGTSGNGQGGRTGSTNGLEQPNFASDQVEILSDPKGYDFGPYLNGVLNRIRLNWYPLIPEIARYSRGRVSIVFTIEPDGTVYDAHIVINSGKNPLDLAAMGSITGSNPFEKLPKNFSGDHLTLQITYFYNMNP